MIGDARVLELLEEMLDSGRTPEEVCRERPDLLPEVRERWQRFRRIDAAVVALLPGLDTRAEGDAILPPPTACRLPQVPGYEVEAVLGCGGVGVVYKARQRALDRPVALKMLLSGPFAAPELLERFRRETAALAGLRHPNIVPVYDAGEVEGRPYFAMELVEGGSVAQQLAGAPQPARQAAELLAVLAGAVSAAHQSGVVHRDLKPANILLAADGTPKVADFGLARRVEGGPALTQTGVAVGTPSYMAPEQARGQTREVGPASDTYALGAILYECLTGRPPFRAETATETVLQVIHQEPAPPSRLNPKAPRDLETICLKCLQKDPAKRYATAAHLAADLGRFLRHEPIDARPTGRLEHALQWARRRPATAGLLAAVALLALMACVGGGLLYRQWAAARERQAETDRDVHAILVRAQGPLEAAWQAQDAAQLTAALAEGNRALDVARSGAASAAVRQEAEAFRADAEERLGRARKNRVLSEALLDVSDARELSIYDRDEVGRPIGPAEPSVDEQYAAAFRAWGLDVDAASEDEAAARLGAEPDVVVQETTAALDGWMLERRRQDRPEPEWRRLLRLAERLDRSERHRRLRTLLVGESPPRAEGVASIVGAPSPWPALWELSRGNRWRQLREVAAGIDPRTDPVPTVILLAEAYAAVGDAAGAERLLGEAATARPDQAALLDALGKLLEGQGLSRSAKAVEYFRAARALRPRLGIALSDVLIRAGRPDEAESVLRDMLRQGAETPELDNLVGVSLDAQKKYGPAEASYRRAIDLAPDFADAHYNLGLCLDDQQEHEAAEAAFRKAADLRPQDAKVYLGLGNALAKQSKFAAAEAAFRTAIGLRPDWAAAYFNLGNALTRQGKHDAAAAAFRKATELRPDFALAHNNLGLALRQLLELEAAEAAFRKAVALRPDYTFAYNNLGMMLSEQGKYVEAEAAFRKAIGLAPEFPLAYFNLAHALVEQGRFDDGLAVVTKGDRLLPAQDPVREQTRAMVQQCQHCLDLNARLPAVLRGTDKPADAFEQFEFAQVCLRKKLCAAAARFYGDAFSADPELTQSVSEDALYEAARAAALAGCGQGTDAAALEDRDRARWRRQALDWLREDLTRWAKTLDDDSPLARSAVWQRLRHWQLDGDLAGLREPDALERMSPDERNDCRALWGEVAGVLRRAQTMK